MASKGEEERAEMKELNELCEVERDKNVKSGEKEKSKHWLKIKIVFSRHSGNEDKTSRLSSACLRV